MKILPILVMAIVLLSFSVSATGFHTKYVLWTKWNGRCSDWYAQYQALGDIPQGDMKLGKQHTEMTCKWLGKPCEITLIKQSRNYCTIGIKEKI